MATAAARPPYPGLTVSIDPAATIVAADPERLQQIIANLVSNAIKFTPPDGRVDVRVDQEERETRIIVADTGRGIAKEMLPRLFDDFWQARAGGADSSPGLGLGLAIVRQLVELHGGRVCAASDGVGAGAMFTVTLPAHRAAVDQTPTGAAGSGCETMGDIAPVRGEDRS